MITMLYTNLTYIEYVLFLLQKSFYHLHTQGNLPLPLHKNLNQFITNPTNPLPFHPPLTNPINFPHTHK